MSYEFDDDFQTKIAAMALRDPEFNSLTEGLVEPGYINDEAEAALVGLALDYWRRYRSVASPVTFKTVLTTAFDTKRLRDDMKDEIKKAYIGLMKADISDRAFVVEKVAEFARHQAVMSAMEQSVGELDKGGYDRIRKLMTEALDIGVSEDGDCEDAFEDRSARALRRKERAAGKIVPGITTGHRKLDDQLYHKGWGRRELSLIMGGAKAGKSFTLMNFAVNAAVAGYNVLKVTLENSKDITLDRIDAYIAEVETANLDIKIDEVEKKVGAALDGKGALKVHEYATGSFAPSDLRRLIERYRSKGIIFDLIVIDYWDIMRPDERYPNSPRHESASIGMGLRAIAKAENCAVLTAIQTNREGHKAHTAKAEHAAEDFNKIRLADIVISISADEDEHGKGEARIYIAASRNSAGQYQMPITRDLAKANAIKKFVSKL